ncbi:MAG: GNAT family N-acetyltransferase [Defluviitaleaceae bacterium]|nr:GNAT family N-acetyltransferase [Defluviitaleaceae bacterium]
MKLFDGNLIIRKAEIEDAAILGRWWRSGVVMAHAGFPNGLPVTDEEIKNKFKQWNGKHGLLILEADHVPIGEMSYNSKGNGIAQIGIKICVQEMQSKGYGSRYLSLLIDELFKRGYNQIVLDTNAKNTSAQRTYEKLGFKKVGVRENSWKNQLGELQTSIDYKLDKSDWK